MKALIDGDIFQWEFGTATDDEYKPLPWHLVQARIDSRIQGILEATGADSYQIYITTDDKSNFRYEVATIKPYKGHRKTEKPYWYTHIRNFLVDYRGAQEISGQEADDALSIEQTKDYRNKCQQLPLLFDPWNTPQAAEWVKKNTSTVICSRDKDLHMVSGWHYTWHCGKQKEKELWWQDEIGGYRCFYKQLLTGDAVDNIPGLYGVGRASTRVNNIDSLCSKLEMYMAVMEEYKKRFGSYAEQFLIENARLLWMRREEGELWGPPVKEDKEND